MYGCRGLLALAIHFFQRGCGDIEITAAYLDAYDAFARARAKSWSRRAEVTYILHDSNQRCCRAMSIVLLFQLRHTVELFSTESVLEK